eukprot:1510794-Pleurochrysis_carterae.AAC.1
MSQSLSCCERSCVSNVRGVQQMGDRMVTCMPTTETCSDSGATYGCLLNRLLQQGVQMSVSNAIQICIMKRCVRHASTAESAACRR